MYRERGNDMYIKHTVSHDAQGTEPTEFIEGKDCKNVEEMEEAFVTLAISIWEGMVAEFGYPKIKHYWEGNKLVMSVIGQENLFNSLEIILDK
jgi:hypothetical protein